LPPARLARHVEAVRRFNRFYTRQIGVLEEGLLRSPFSLTEARVIWELANREVGTAGEIAQALGLDAGYMSRIVRSFRSRGLIERTPSGTDARQYDIALTERGQDTFGRLNASSRREIETMLDALTADEQVRLVDAMVAIETMLHAPPERRVPYILRPHQPGDIGWVIHRHGVLYDQEYGWNEEFEMLVAQIAARFLETFDAARERCWIAERDGENVGSVFLVAHPERDGVAKLRMLLVEPKARGLGLGRRLVSECTRFARRVGYRAITLWTNSVLTAARAIYTAEGYRLVQSEPNHQFGTDVVNETWELEL
jgi:DNA-binding MarR family transcriptional regulator/GNAT superfamily N-acetyltransferase